MTEVEKLRTGLEYDMTLGSVGKKSCCFTGFQLR